MVSQEVKDEMLGLAMRELVEAMPSITRYNSRMQRHEPVQEVKVTLRRRTGQWFVSVGKFSAAKPELAMALAEVTDRINGVRLDPETREFVPRR